MHDIEQRDRELLAALQGDIPLISTPFAGLGQVIDMSEKEVLKRTDRLKRAGVIKLISAVFDAKALGYRSCIVAAKVEDDALDRAASTVNLHPGVTQNYRRNHPFNLWFTIAVAPDSKLGLERTVDILAEEGGIETVRLLPTLRSFKSGENVEAEQAPVEPREIASEEAEVVKMLQGDLPLQPRPFDALAKTETISGDEILAIARALHQRQQLKRITAILPAKRQNFSATAMGVWAVPEKRVEEVGQLLAAQKFVSQCFLRPTYDDWPYNIFTVVHARSVDECETLLSDAAHELEIIDMRVLFPVKEYKRSRLPLFSSEFAQWEAGRLGQSKTSVAS